MKNIIYLKILSKLMIIKLNKYYYLFYNLILLMNWFNLMFNIFKFQIHYENSLLTKYYWIIYLF